jgi:uncharacterized membrane protein YqaE (UPF0057 family)
MKTTIKISALFVITIALFSCGSMDVMKRRYNNGFYVHHSSKHHTDRKVTADEKVNANTPVKEVIADNSAEEIVMEKESHKSSSSVFAVSVENKKVKSNAKRLQIENKTAEENVLVSNERVQYTKEEKRQLDQKGSGAADDTVMLLLLIVLAVFLPPLAVYLKRDTADKWFWITLILCLLAFIGFGFNPIFGLWFIAIVIALLVVLDVIS